MKQNKVRLTESQLRNMITNIINEEKIKQQQNLFESVLNESMVFPNEVKNIWWDGDESFVVLGEDGRWYDVYPNYGDAYMKDCEADKLFQSYVDKITQAYMNNGIRPRVFTYNWGRNAEIIDETNEPRFFEKINTWLEKRGFTLEEAPSEDNWGWAKWKFSGEYGSDEQNPEKLAQVAKMQDVTNEVGDFFADFGGPKEQSRKALAYLQKYLNKTSLKLMSEAFLCCFNPIVTYIHHNIFRYWHN